MSRPEDSSISTDLATVDPTSPQPFPHASSANELSRAATHKVRPIELIVRFSNGQEYLIVPESDVEWQLDIDTPMPTYPFGARSGMRFAKHPIQQTFLLRLMGRVASAVVTAGPRRLPDGS